ncbi:MAG TPA: choice-of-anchor tandem repeat GloVer-containing protein [Rhizomicrobium sp.]|nr:choice-of-anchor tandem repeat GloVer-containing protein [Rhizomicrobium sp.]
MKTVSVGLLAGIVGCALVQPGSAAETGTYKEQILHSFAGGTDGAKPVAGLIDVHGVLYGTTGSGGTGCSGHGCGTMFAIDPSTGTETVLYSFCSLQNCADGSYPYAGLIDVGGTLYGTTAGGGGTGCSGPGCGTVFSIDPGTGAETVLHSFNGGRDGSDPVAGLIDVKGKLYGTTVFGGGRGCYEPGCGTVFMVDRKSGAEKVLYSFCSQKHCADGSEPNGGLIAVGGLFYGTTSEGGASGAGTVFSIDPNTRAETVLYSFCSQQSCPDGSSPDAGLIDVNGLLYGTTELGGDGSGTVFSIDPTTGAETVLHSFDGSADGSNPFAGLIDVNGVLYGTTAEGGTSFRDSNGGTVFSVNPTTGAETVLYSFCAGHRTCPGDGTHPFAGLIDIHGGLYGTTQAGGADGYGTVFELKEKRR